MINVCARSGMEEVAFAKVETIFFLFLLFFFAPSEKQNQRETIRQSEITAP